MGQTTQTRGKQNMSDPISREAAIDATLTFIVEYCGAAFDEDMQKMLCERLDALPSAEPKRGKWIMKKDPYEVFDEIPVCSNCGCAPTFRRTTAFCEHCGARMEVDHEND